MTDGTLNPDRAIYIPLYISALYDANLLKICPASNNCAACWICKLLNNNSSWKTSVMRPVRGSDILISPSGRSQCDSSKWRNLDIKDGGYSCILVLVKSEGC